MMLKFIVKRSQFFTEYVLLYQVVEVIVNIAANESSRSNDSRKQQVVVIYQEIYFPRWVEILAMGVLYLTNAHVPKKIHVYF
jgi:hypothetical protein